MAEVWSDDGRHFAIYKESGHPAEWSDEAIPELVHPEVSDAWGWRLAIRSEDGRGEKRPGLDSGARFTTREAAIEDLLAQLKENQDPDLADLPIVDWLTGESLEDESS